MAINFATSGDTSWILKKKINQDKQSSIIYIILLKLIWIGFHVTLKLVYPIVTQTLLPYKWLCSYGYIVCAH